MPGFLYYLPNQTSPPTKEELAARGLAYAFNRPPALAGVSNVFGSNGGIAFDPDLVDAGRAAYRPERQEWIQIPGLEVWVGVEKDAIPSPGDLQRETMLGGEAVELADGRRWIVPIARSWPEEGGWRDELPRIASIGPDGRWSSGKTLPRYSELYQVSCDYFAYIFGTAAPEEESRLNSQGIYSAAALALQANYLIGPAECSLLGLFTRQHAVEVLNALVQREAIEALLQKKMEVSGSVPGSADPNTSHSSAGPADSTATTAPVT